MVSIDDSLCSSYLSLFFSIHYMVGMNPITVVVVLVCWLLIQIIYSLAVLIYHDLVVVVISTSIILCGSCVSSCFVRFLSSRAWSWDFITLNVLLLLLMVLLCVLGIMIAWVFGSASLLRFVIFSLLICTILLCILLLKRHTIIIQHNLFIRTASCIILSILLIGLTKPFLCRYLLTLSCYLSTNFLLTGSISHLSIVMLIFNFLQTFISYAWFIRLFWDNTFPIFYWFLGVVRSSIVGLGCRCKHVLLIIIVVDNWFTRFEIFTYACIDCLSTYLVATWSFNFNHVLNFIGIITSSFLTALSSNCLSWSYTFLPALTLASRWCFGCRTTGDDAHPIFL